MKCVLRGCNTKARWTVYIVRVLTDDEILKRLPNGGGTDWDGGWTSLCTRHKNRVTRDKARLAKETRLVTCEDQGKQ